MSCSERGSWAPCSDRRGKTSASGIPDIGVVVWACRSAGFVSRTSDPMLLSRLVDTSGLTETEFHSWLSGLASLLPQLAVWAS